MSLIHVPNGEIPGFDSFAILPPLAKGKTTVLTVLNMPATVKTDSFSLARVGFSQNCQKPCFGGFSINDSVKTPFLAFLTVLTKINGYTPDSKPVYREPLEPARTRLVVS